MNLFKYATADFIIVPIIKRGVVDFAVSADWTPAAGDVKVSLDGGTAANIATLPTFITSIGWKFSFSSGETTCKQLNINIVDSATKAIEDQHIIITTYGHASAQIVALPADVIRLLGTAWLTPAVAGTPDVNTKTLTDGAITSAKFATDAIAAAAVKADAVTKIQTGLATPTNITAGTIANVSGNVAGSVGSISGVTFPANFGATLINSSGHVSRVTLVDTTTTNSDMRGTDGANTTTPPTASEIAIATEAAIFNDGDATALLTAIGNTVEQFLLNDGDAQATLAAIASAVRTNLATELGRIDVAISSRNSTTPPTATAISDVVRAGIITDHGSGAYTTATGFATPVNVTDAVSAIVGGDSDTLETLSDQIDGVSAEVDKVPKSGETRRYTQIASDATTTDVSIGDAL